METDWNLMEPDNYGNQRQTPLPPLATALPHLPLVPQVCNFTLFFHCCILSYFLRSPTFLVHIGILQNIVIVHYSLIFF